MTYTIFKRVFERQPLRERTADELRKVNERALEDLKEREENDLKRNLEVEKGNDENGNLKIRIITRLIS